MGTVHKIKPAAKAVFYHLPRKNIHSQSQSKPKSVSWSGACIAMPHTNASPNAFAKQKPGNTFPLTQRLMERFKYYLYLLYLQVLQLEIRYSEHAEEQMVARGISRKEVEEGIAKGSKELQKPDKMLSYCSYFCVVYKKIGETIFVITVKPR